jgi:hypothetical protein
MPAKQEEGIRRIKEERNRSGREDIIEKIKIEPINFKNASFQKKWNLHERYCHAYPI